MLFALGTLLFGLAALAWGGNRFVDGAIALARRMGIPPLIVGMTIVTIGTSTPELFVSISAAIEGHAGIALGNILGSNIANILFLFGIAAIAARTMTFDKTVLKQGETALLAATLLFILAFVHIPFGFGAEIFGISRPEALLLLIAAGWYWFALYRIAEKNREIVTKEDPDPLNRESSTESIIGFTFLGLILLIAGGNFATDGAVELARIVGLSESFIALSIIALGTSLPEMTTALVSVRKKHFDLLFGNLVGASISNTLLILGISGMITQLSMSPEIARSIALNLLAAVIFILAVSIPKRGKVEHWKGWVLIFAYIAILFSGYTSFPGTLPE